MRQGEVFRYRYLWAHEQAAGREDGKKVRLCCLVVHIKNQLYMLPITSQEPISGNDGEERIYLPIPEPEAQRLDLTKPSYLVLDEFNQTADTDLFDFEGTVPVARISNAFLKRAAALMLEGIRKGRSKPVRRTS